MVFMGGLGHGLADGGPSTRDIMELIRKLEKQKIKITIIQLIEATNTRK
jgi:hypothetical protein